MLSQLDGAGSPLRRWSAAADLWCAYWFWEDGKPPPSKGFGTLVDLVAGTLHEQAPALQRWLTAASTVAEKRRFFHWTLEFPEVFADADGRSLADPGFDAVLGNPPWDMVRADDTRDSPADLRASRKQLVRFARASGVYRWSGSTHLNLYQLFVERAVALTRPSGRIGLVVPAGFATDQGTAPLRRLLLERCSADAIVGIENRLGIFPIHRGVRFLLVTASRGGPTQQIACRFGLTKPDDLDHIPSAGAPLAAFPIKLTPGLLQRVSGPALTIPELRTSADLALIDRLTSRWPPLADRAGWHAHFGRELNATDDRRFMSETGAGLPVIGGKQIEPFRIHLRKRALCIPEAVAARLLDRRTTFDRFRVAYRDVSAATNRLTLIAAVVPPGVVTTHTLFCVKTPPPPDGQHVLCALLNSLVANYLVRQCVTSHVTVGIVEQLPIPLPSPTSPACL